jgi:hypothetical protein
MPTLTKVPTSQVSADATTWDARAEVDIGLIILRYISESPPPEGSVVVDSLTDWGERLLADGRRRLEDLGASPLRSIGGEA